MAIFKGRDELIKNFNAATRDQDKKGLYAEIEVGDLLSKNLPNDTYVISHPEIGKMQPDFLVISPSFGFRIIEVKNFSIRYIEEVFSNGLLKTKYGKINPLGQVKKHVDAFNNYLISSHPNLGIDDPYRMIGYCVIHKGFSKKEFEYKFGRQLSNLSAQEKNDYFRNHLFFNELGSNLNFILERASKFHYPKFPLRRDLIKEISDNVKLYAIKKNDDEVYRRIFEQEEITERLNTEVKQIKEDMEIYRLNIQKDKSETNQKDKGKLRILLIPIIGVLAIIFTLVIINQQGSIGILENDNKISSNSDVLDSFSNLDSNVDEYVTLEAKVNRFYFDSKSGTKFLTLSDGEQEIEAVIFKHTKVPFIEEGDSLVFEGFIQNTRDGKGIELRIERIDK
ncbi:hypothetical protein DZB84_10370 [Bacillus sp. HNG]|uniref:NERD domain-containing protein n=1 Tax=Bacillus sp. HNG TaxID=2293325 RepID=UPI000E2EFA4B|nr:NERD domain-containing protein [Bacillus sp. HNG]RFB17458.1 hypothetical protein DZB84_10370 [Bacillus sp. HNG]